MWSSDYNTYLALNGGQLSDGYGWEDHLENGIKLGTKMKIFKL